MEPLYTLDEVASLLKLEVGEVNDLIAAGQLNVVRLLGKHVRVRETDLKRCLEESMESDRKTVPETGDRMCPTFAGRTQFRVQGSVEDGARVWPGGKALYPVRCSKEFFGALLKKYRGQTVKVGLSFSDQGAGSLGAHIKRALNTKMNPTTYLAGLLVDEGYAERSEPGYIRFFSRRQGNSRPENDR
jgi:excisionase family DNA binding protein